MRRHWVAACVCVLAACAPVSYARLADVAKPGGFRLLATTNFASSRGSARVRPTSPSTTSGTAKTLRGNVAAVNLAGYGLFAPMLGFVYYSEAQAAFGVFDPCELGAALSVLRGGLELRCAVLRPEPAGIGVALGTALFHHTVFGSDVGAASFQWRSTLEVSGKGNSLTPLLNVALGYGRTQRHLDDGSDLYLERQNTFSEGFDFRSSGIFAVRDEWKLGVPLGLSIPLNPPRDAALVFGVVPEWTLASTDRSLICVHCEQVSVIDFEQKFSVFFTVGIHGLDD